MRVRLVLRGDRSINLAMAELVPLHYDLRRKDSRWYRAGLGGAGRGRAGPGGAADGPVDRAQGSGLLRDDWPIANRVRVSGLAGPTGTICSDLTRERETEPPPPARLYW